jgi:hypothetical protein
MRAIPRKLGLRTLGYHALRIWSDSETGEKTLVKLSKLQIGKPVAIQMKADYHIS